jgi:microcystin-dependent protein
MEPFLGQIVLFPDDFAPTGWALCQGQLLPIAQNTALFSLLGTQFGGNGTSNFALPNLQGRVPNGQGQGPGLQNYGMGEQVGAETVTVVTATVPPHAHGFQAFGVSATTNAPAGALPAESHTGAGRGGAVVVNLYSAGGTATTLAPGAVAATPSGGQPHNNMQPFLVLNWCIAMQGVYPARS